MARFRMEDAKNGGYVLTKVSKPSMGKSLEQIREELINSGDIHLANLEKELNDRELSHLIELVKKKGFDRG